MTLAVIWFNVVRVVLCSRGASVATYKSLMTTKHGWAFCAAAVAAVFALQVVAGQGGLAYPPALAGFPSPFIWQNRPAKWSADAHSLTLAAGKKTDWFVYPGGGYTPDSSPRWLFKPADDFMFSAKIAVDAHATYDAGCLALYASTSTWAKFCLEAQADHRLAVISVVTRGMSDDATSFPVNGTSICLKIAKAGGAIFFYESEDCKTWVIARKFNLQPADSWLAGFSVQSPEGNGASALFTDLHYLPEKPNLWNVQ